MAKETPLAPIKRKMSAKQRAFFEAYIINHNVIQSYHDAGYVPPSDTRGPVAIKNCAYAVLQGQRIKDALDAHTQHVEHQARIAAAMSLDWIVDEHRRLMAKAEEKGNLAVATKNLEMIGRTRGIYQDTLTLDVGARQALSDAEEIEARRLAGLLVADTVSGQGTSPVRDPADSGDEIVGVEIVDRENDGAEEDEGPPQGV